jgi:methionyl-tRNA formyltransferase
MNIVLLLNHDIASNLALNLLLPSLSHHKVSVFLSSKVGGSASRPEALQHLAQFEQQDIFHALKKQQKSSNDNEFKNFTDIAKENKITIETLNAINTADGVAKIQLLSPDLIISVRYGVILKKPIIDLATVGVINLHSGQLPAYRGVMATFWAMFNGERTLTATLHTITDSTIDTGGTIATATIDVEQKKSYLWHVLSLYVGGCELIKQTLNRIENGHGLNAIEQSSEGRYYSFPNEEQITEFSRLFGNLYQSEDITTLLSSLINESRVKK